MQYTLHRGLRPGHKGMYGRVHGVSRVRALALQGSLEAPARPVPSVDAATELGSSHVQLLQGLQGPLVKIATHYHVHFGDCLKVVGSSPEFGSWQADAAPVMTWGEGDVWSLLVPLPAGEYEFKVVVQQGTGGLIWEAGEANRKVTVPEDAPLGSMLVADCAFNFIELMPEPELQPVTPDVLGLLEDKAAEQQAAAEAAAAAEVAVANSAEAAAAVAKALATMDAEAEESGVRPPSAPSTAEASLDSQEAVVSEAAGQAGAGDEAAEDREVPAAVQASVQDVSAAAEQEMEANMEEMALEVHPFDESSSSATPPSAAAVHAKLTQDKPVAIGFVGTPAAAADPSNVVAAFMKSVGVSKPPQGDAAGSKTPASAADDASSAVAAATSDEITAAAAEAAPVEISLPAVEAAPEAAVEAAPENISLPAAEAAPEAAAEEISLPAVTAAALDAGSHPAEAPAPAAAAAARAAKDVDTPAAAAPTPTPSPVSTGSSTAAASRSDQMPEGWVSSASPFPSRPSNSGSWGNSLSATAAGTPPSSPTRGKRSNSPGRGSSHVVSAAAAAAVAAEWIQGVRSNEAVNAAREAERAANEVAARLQQARERSSAAAAEAARLGESMKRSVLGGAFSGNGGGGGGGGTAYGKGLEGASAAYSTLAPLSPPPITPATGSGLAAARTALSASAAAAVAAGASGPNPPAVVSMPSSGASRAVAAAASASASDADAWEGAGEGIEADGSWGAGMQLLAAVVGCAAVGTVMWSEFVLKETGCGLPPGPYGLLGAAEGLSYLAVLGFAGAGVSARIGSGGSKGLPGALAVPETLAYGALAAGLMVLASQLHQYGYIPPPLPGGQCYADSAVALPNADELNAQLTAQMVALQAVLSQLKSSAAEGLDQLQLQQQLAALQTQVDAFSGYMSSQAAALDTQVQAGLTQLQDSLATATVAVSSFVDTHLQQLDLSGKVESVLSILRAQEQQLKEELPKQLAALQSLAATSMAVVQDTALQAASSLHLPELLSSLDQTMAMLHDVLETRIQSLDSVLRELQGSIDVAASQLAAAVLAAEQTGSAEAAAQMHSLQEMLSLAMADVQQQVWGSYQQLALADKLSDMLLTVRTSAAAAAASATAEVDKLKLQEHLTELELLAEASAAALAANAVEQIDKLQLQDRLAGIAEQASAAMALLQAGLQQQYAQQLPEVEAQLGALQARLADLTASTQQQLQDGTPELEALLKQLQQSMEATMRVVGEVAATGATAATDAVHHAGEAASAGISAAGQQLASAGGADGFSSSLTAAGVQSEAASSIAPVAVNAIDMADAASAAAAAVDAAPVESAAAAADAVVTAIQAAPMETVSTVAAIQAAPVEPVSTVAAAAAADQYGFEASAPPSNWMQALQAADAEELRAAAERARYIGVGFDLSDASDAAKAIWAARPQ